MRTFKFWPLDYDPEGEIYDNVAWDLPGFRAKLRNRPEAFPKSAGVLSRESCTRSHGV